MSCHTLPSGSVSLFEANKQKKTFREEIKLYLKYISFLILTFYFENYVSFNTGAQFQEST